jgi:uncharacterized coiled-coil protein SlyX
METDKHKAIIQGELHRKIYSVSYRYRNRNIIPDKVERLNKLKCDLADFQNLTIEEKSCYVANKELWRGEIDAPLLEVGEKLYIGKLDIEIIVNERLRHTNGSYIYRCNYIIEEIDDEESEASKKKATDHLKKIKQIIAHIELQINELKNEIKQSQEEDVPHVDDEEVYQSSWFQRLFK